MKIMRLLPVLAALLCGGCGLFWDDPYFDVTTAPLNWLEVHYYNARHDPVYRESVRITGDGYVQVKSGTSMRVSDSYAKNFSDMTWDDIRTQQFHVDPNTVRQTFQELVNAGLFDKDKILTKTRFPSPGRFIAVRAALEGLTYSEPYNIFEKDPELAELLFNLVRQFKTPTVGRRNRGGYVNQPGTVRPGTEDAK